MGSSGTGSMGSAEPVNFGRGVLEPINFSGRKTVNEFAPQHLQLQTERPWELLPLIRHAGAISIGHSTPGVVGEYVAGPSQTLPTSGNCRYASPLGVETFLKHSSIIQYSNPALTKVVDTIDALAYSEGFSSHSDSVKRRLSTDE